jgi:hypothetical protein
VSERLAARAGPWSRGGTAPQSGGLARAASLGVLCSFPAPAGSMRLFVVLLPQIVTNCQMRERAGKGPVNVRYRRAGGRSVRSCPRMGLGLGFPRARPQAGPVLMPGEDGGDVLSRHAVQVQVYLLRPCAARIIDCVADLCLRQQPGRGDGRLAECCSRSSTCRLPGTRVPCQNSYAAAELGLVVSSACSSVFADQAATVCVRSIRAVTSMTWPGSRCGGRWLRAWCGRWPL